MLRCSFLPLPCITVELGCLFRSVLNILKRAMKTYSTTRKAKTTQDLSMCRMCLCRCSEMIEIFEQEEPLSNAVIIEFCTGISCNREDGLPCVVCQECYRNLVDFFAFKRMCLASYDRLKLSRESANKDDNPSTDIIKAPEPDDALSLVKSDGNGLDLLESDCIHPGAPYDVFSQIVKGEAHFEELEQALDDRDISTDGDVNEEEEDTLTDEIDDKRVVILSPIPKKSSTQSVKVYTCQYCSKQYSAPASLRRHMACHQGKRLQCAECDRVFVQKDSLKRHLLLHTNRDFSCSICSKPLVSKEGLRCHLRTHHSQRTEDTYFKHKCKLCEKKFAHASGLSRHMIIHRNMRKQYVCRTCNAIFNQHQDLKNHSKSHVQENGSERTPVIGETK